MNGWELTSALNLVVAIAYVLIAATILRGLAHTGQLRRVRANRLAFATAAIFLTCAMHHGHHGLALAVDDGTGTQAGLRAASSGWYGISIDALSAVVGIVYLTLRRYYGILVRSPAMFDLVGQAHYRQLAANLPHTAVFVFDTDLKIVLAEGRAIPGSRQRLSELEGRPISAAVSAESLAVFEAPWRAALAGESSDFDDRSPSGEQVYRNRVRPVFDEHGVVVGGLLLSEDVTAERATQAQLVRAHAFNDAVLSASPDITIITELSAGAVTWASRSVPEMLGWDASHDPDLLSLAADEDVNRLRAADSAVRDLADGESSSVRFRLLGADGQYRWISRRTTPFGRDDEGAVTHGLSLLREITDVVASEQQLEHAALHDPLTGLPNRILLMDRINSAIDRADRSDGEIAVLFADVDSFKRVNDSAGHAVGDAVLIEVAARIRQVLRKGDTIGRVGGDEFVIVLEPRGAADDGSAGRGDPDDDPVDGLAGEIGARGVAELIAERLRGEVARPMIHGGTEYIISLSIGMALATKGSTAEGVVRDADAAMYRAKNRGKNRLEVFDDELRTDTAERARVDAALTAALTAGGPAHPALTVAYQPIIDLADGRLVGFEALARLTDSFGHPIPPDTFIPIAEETGVIAELGETVLDVALSGLSQWRREHPDAQPAVVHVNLSARQAQQADMPAVVRKALLHHGLGPADLILELTESILLQAGSSAIRQLAELHRAGVGIAIDDFGTGYASLRYLAILPISVVKIDRTFTAAMLSDPTSATIVRAIAALSADMGLQCIVEGIESTEQLGALPPGVLGQGYLLGRPAESPSHHWRRRWSTNDGPRGAGITLPAPGPIVVLDGPRRP